MSGSYKGAQARIIQKNPLAKFCPCACHSLNLCGVSAAECCPEVIMHLFWYNPAIVHSVQLQPTTVRNFAKNTYRVLLARYVTTCTLVCSD